MGELYTVIIQVTVSCVYPLNKQLHALSSALYQKFATFTALLSFCFSVKSDCIRVMGARPSLLWYGHTILARPDIGANAYCHLIGRDDENILSSCIDQSNDTLHLL